MTTATAPLSMHDALTNVLGYHTPLASRVIHDMWARYGSYERAIARRDSRWVMSLLLDECHRLINEVDCGCRKLRGSDYRDDEYWRFVHVAREECHRAIWCLLEQAGMRKPLLTEIRTQVVELEHTPSEKERLHAVAYFLRSRSAEEWIARPEMQLEVPLAS